MNEMRVNDSEMRKDETTKLFNIGDISLEIAKVNTD